MRRLSRGLLLALCSASILAVAPAHAGLMDKIFGSGSTPADAPRATPGQRLWTIREFTQIQLVPREAGAPENQQPVQLSTEGLRQQLALIEIPARSGTAPLFATDELNDLVVPLVQALAVAGPGDDVLLLSSSRREGGILGSPMAVTARIFVQGGALQFIAHDSRYDFYDNYRGTHIEPKFTYGSRTAAGVAVLQSASASNRRPDWLSISLQGPSAPNVPVAAPATPAAPAPLLAVPATAPAPAAVVAPVARPAAPPAAVPAAPRKPLDAAGAEEIERRLETLKRLRDKNLISEDEYQQKRREILQLL